MVRLVFKALIQIISMKSVFPLKTTYKLLEPQTEKLRRRNVLDEWLSSLISYLRNVNLGPDVCEGSQVHLACFFHDVKHQYQA